MITYIFGIDPGFTCTGISLLKSDKKRIQLVNFDTAIEPKQNKKLTDDVRVELMSKTVLKKLNDIMSKTQDPNFSYKFAIETIFSNGNSKSLVMQARLFQAIECLLWQYNQTTFSNGIEDSSVHEYHPNTVKATIYKGSCSKGAAHTAIFDKKLIPRKMLELIDEESDVKQEAILDAVAIAYTGIVLHWGTDNSAK